MKFSIITPTLMRDSLLACCASIDVQTHSDWEHIIVSDGMDIRADLLPYESVKRSIYWMPKRGNYGNQARHMAWELATGDYEIFVDDDNLLYTDHALADIAHALESNGRPDFALFPIHRHGNWFLIEPPGMNMTDSANIVVKRELGRWPDITAREADGHFVEALKSRHDYMAFPNVEPIVLMETSSNGI